MNSGFGFHSSYGRMRPVATLTGVSGLPKTDELRDMLKLPLVALPLFTSCIHSFIAMPLWYVAVDVSPGWR
eukprot:scaffold323766_cov33-Tisochrysis_lutea.AAC.2